MLSVAIKRNGPVKTHFESMRKSGLKGSALTLIAAMADDDRAGGLSVHAGFVRGTIIDDDDEREPLPQCLHQPGDGFFFVETGNYSGAGHTTKLF